MIGKQAKKMMEKKPEPTTIMEILLLLLGATRFILDLYSVHFVAKGPFGIFELSFIFLISRFLNDNLLIGSII